MKKTSRTVSLRFCLFFLIMLLGAAFIPESGAATAKAPGAAVDLTKAVPDSKTTAPAPAAAVVVKPAPDTKININTADKAKLEKIPEIGPVKAQAIIDGRPYKTVEDVMRVKGIKGKVFEVIKEYITVK